MYVTGEAITLAATKQIVLRAVKTGDQTIVAMAVGSADSLEKSMAEAAAGLAKKRLRLRRMPTKGRQNAGNSRFSPCAQQMPPLRS